jgi:hypothetical protein
VAIPTGIISVVNNRESPKNIVLCHFDTIALPKQIPVGTPDVGPVFTEYRTQVELTYLTPDRICDRAKDDLLLSEVFNKCIESLNSVLVAYLLKTQDFDVYRVSTPMLQSVVPGRLVAVEDWVGGEPNFLHLLHVNLPVEKPLQTHAEMLDVASYTSMLKEKRNPFALSQEIMLNAWRHIRGGFYQEAVAFANLSVEVFLRRLHIELQVEIEGKRRSEAEAITDGIPFAQLVKSEFHPKLGGRWNVEDDSTKVGNWYKNTYLVRNRIIHDSYFPEEWESRMAIDSAQGMREYVVGLIRSKRKKFAKICLYFSEKK